MEKLEDMAFEEGSVKSSDPKVEYKGITELEDAPYKSGTSIKYWM